MKRQLQQLGKQPRADPIIGGENHSRRDQVWIADVDSNKMLCKISIHSGLA
jgi:hypothetical protein